MVVWPGIASISKTECRMSYHVVPQADLYRHELASTCACQPDLKMENEEMIFVHHAWDARELLERALYADSQVDSSEQFTYYCERIFDVHHRLQRIDRGEMVRMIQDAYARLFNNWKEKGFTVTVEDRFKLNIEDNQANA